MEKVNQKLGSSWKKRLILILAVCFLSANAHAALTTISDEESEQLLQSLVEPIFKAAGINFNRNKVFIVEDDSLNAFVSDGNNLFINSEVIIKAANADEIRGVAAHEVGHIMGGHILRQKLKMKELQNISLASMAVAGALGAASGRGDVAAAVVFGSQGSLINQSLAYQVEEERSADEAAVKLLNKTGHSPTGLMNFMKKIQAQNRLQGISEDGYFRTHPMSGERVAFLRQAAQNSPNKPVVGADEQLKRVQAKLFAFIKSPERTYTKYPSSDNSVAAQYARAIAAYKAIRFDKALSLIDGLIAKEPNNPHFRELKGQILLEQGKIAAAQKEFAKASSLMPKSALFKINEAQAALENNPTPKEIRQIIAQLQKAINERPTLISWLLLARAYELNGQTAEAQYTAAEYSLRTGDFKLAQKQAETAKRNSLDPTLTLKIDDLLRRVKDQSRR